VKPERGATRPLPQGLLGPWARIHDDSALCTLLLSPVGANTTLLQAQSGKGTMRFAKFFLMLGCVLGVGSVTKADEIRVTAHAVFQPQNAGPGQQFIFSSTFLYELDTNQLVPGSMSTHVEDTLGGTPYTDWVPKPNFHGPTFTYFDPDLDEIQLLFGLPGGSLMYPAIGSYPVTDIGITCVTFACADHFGPLVLSPVEGELTISAVPEPNAHVLLLCAASVLLTLISTKSLLPR
jgi:hypothetical protein